MFANVLDKAAEKDEQDWACFIAEKEHLVKYILQVCLRHAQHTFAFALAINIVSWKFIR